MASTAEVPEERFLERFPMFQGKVREVLVKTVNDHIHDVHPLLQLQNPILPLSFHRVLKGSNPRSPSASPVRVFIPSLLPELSRSIMGGQEVHGDSVVLSDDGGGVV
jgi:hypothetical protein